MLSCRPEVASRQSGELGAEAFASFGLVCLLGNPNIYTGCLLGHYLRAVVSPGGGKSTKWRAGCGGVCATRWIGGSSICVRPPEKDDTKINILHVYTYIYVCVCVCV